MNEESTQMSVIPKTTNSDCSNDVNVNANVNVIPSLMQQEEQVTTIKFTEQMQVNNTTPPIVHAIGGAIGSALSLLMFYPLERIRVEMMNSAGQISNINSDNSEEEHEEEEEGTSTEIENVDVNTTGAISSSRTNLDTDLRLPSLDTARQDDDGQKDEDESQYDKAAENDDGDDKDDDDDDEALGVKSIASSSKASAGLETTSSYDMLLSATTSVSTTRHADTPSGKDSHHSSPSLSEVSSSSSSCEEEQVMDLRPANESNKNLTARQSSASEEETTRISNTTNAPDVSTSSVSNDDTSHHANASGTTANSNINNNFERRMSMWQCFCNLYQRKELYKGVIPVLCTLAISNFVYFYSHEILKQWLVQNWSRCRRMLLMRNRRLPPPMLASTTRMTTTTTSTAILNNGTTAREITTTTTTTSSDETPSSKRQLILRSFLASTLAGVVNVLLTNPLWVANLRIMQGQQDDPQQQQPRTSLLSEIQYILQHEGIAKLWSGTLTSLLLVSNPTIQHSLYECMKHSLLMHRRKSATMAQTRFGVWSMKEKKMISSLYPLETFLIGAFAKTVATVVTYPLQLAQVLIRFQKQRRGTEASDSGGDDSGPDQQQRIDEDDDGGTCDTVYYKGTWDCITRLYRKGGFRALFVGMDAKLTQTVLTAAFTFLTYEQIVALVRRSYRVPRLSK